MSPVFFGGEREEGTTLISLTIVDCSIEIPKCIVSGPLMEI